MSSFTSALVTRWEDDGTWVIVEGFRYYVGEVESGLFVDVPDGYRTDLTSVPRVLQWLVRKLGKEGPCAAVHDVLYSTGEMSIEIEDPERPGRFLETKVKVTKGISDSIFYESMTVKNVNPLRREALYRGLQVGGFVSWNEHVARRAAAKLRENT